VAKVDNVEQAVNLMHKKTVVNSWSVGVQYYVFHAFYANVTW